MSESYDTRRFDELMDQLERYGTPQNDILDVLEALVQFNDDRVHSRKATSRRKLLELVTMLDLTW